jgi:predicted transcriptional regulator
LGVALKGVMRCTFWMEKKHPNLIKIGKRIREIRKKRGYSQEDFAAAAQLGRSYVNAELDSNCAYIGGRSGRIVSTFERVKSALQKTYSINSIKTHVELKIIIY